MADAGVRHALAFFTAGFSSYSSCRQYLENIEQARQVVGAAAPQVDRLRFFFNHPGYIETMVDRVHEALEQLPAERRSDARLVFTAHSIPRTMADNCRYVEQLDECCRLINERFKLSWKLVFQSRSGPPRQPWLEPDICDYLHELAANGAVREVIVVPVGFMSDHIEVLFDLDTEAREVARQAGLTMVRAATAGIHPRFVRMIRELIQERMSTDPNRPRPALGRLGPHHDVCPPDCCPLTRNVGER
jgi:ferrochelatase